MDWGKSNQKRFSRSNHTQWIPSTCRSTTSKEIAARESSKRPSVRATNSGDPIFVSSDYQWYDEGPEMITTQDELFLFAIAERGRHLYCLVLKKKAGLEDTFERIGITRSYQGGVERTAFGETSLGKRVSIHII
jgi:hypothetical protein